MCPEEAARRVVDLKIAIDKYEKGLDNAREQRAHYDMTIDSYIRLLRTAKADLQTAQQAHAAALEREALCKKREAERKKMIDEQKATLARAVYVERCQRFIGAADDKTWDEIIAAAHEKHFDNLLKAHVQELGGCNGAVVLERNVTYASLLAGPPDKPVTLATTVFGSWTISPSRIKSALQWPGEFSLDTTCDTFHDIE